MQRRTFLGTAAGIGALASLPFAGAQTKTISKPQAADPDIYAPDGYEVPGWLRNARNVYFDGFSPPVYPHMKDFDAKRLVDSVVAVGADTLWFSSIGCWACYPSSVLPRHPELGDRDLIDEVARECRRASIHLYDYTGYGHFFWDVGFLDQHPEYADWVRRDPEGRPWGTTWHIGWAPRQLNCIMNETYREAIRGIIKELSEHDIEGIFLDGPWQHLCFCRSCRRNYKKFTGLDIDRLRPETDPTVTIYDSVYESAGRRPTLKEDVEAKLAWREWAQHSTNEDMLDFRKILHSRGKFLLGGGGFDSGSPRFQYRLNDGTLFEAFPETYLRLAQGMLGCSMTRPYKKVQQMFVGFYNVSEYNQPVHQERGLVVHDTNLEDGDEIRLEGFSVLASGSAPVYTDANRLYFGIGSGGADPLKEVFDLMRRCESIVKDSVPAPYVSAVPTFESLQREEAKPRSWNWEMSKAFTLAMLDARISVDICASVEMSDEWLKGQRVIALCGASGVSDEDARKLAGWVKRGGALLATWDSGLYDEKGNLRKDGGALKDLLGVEIEGEPLSGLPECYYRIQRTHPALGEYTKGVVVMGDNRLLPVKVRSGAELLADCWNLGTGESRGPAIVANQYGQGKTIYVSGSIEANYVSSRVVSLRRLLATIVRYLGGDAPMPFHISAPMGVYGVLRRAANGDLVLWVLAPAGFKDASIGRMRQEFMPVNNVEVRMLVPEERQVKSMRLARADRGLPFTLSGGYAVATIPTLHIGELIHLELA